MNEVIKLLTEKNKTISTMESCTGGGIANAITNIEGSSEVFKFGAVTYSNEYKIKMGVSSNIIDKYTHLPKPKIIRNQTYSLLSKSKFALVSSGTATLETALFEVPQIVCYKGSIISFQIAKRLIDLKFISLVNLISEKEVVRELIQNDLTAENIRRELFNLESNCETIKSDYRILRKLLGNEGASSRAAEEIQKLLQ